MSGNEYRIAVVDRTLDLLETLGSSSVPLGVSEMARGIGATKSAVFRLLVNLERRGYVVRDSNSGKYQLGGELIRLGQRALESSDLRSRARPVLEGLHLRFNETVNLAIFDHTHVSYVDMIESDHGLRMAARVGGIDAMHSTSLGKATLSFLPAAEQERILAGKLERRTERTITDPDELRTELSSIRHRGFAEDNGENEPGSRCFGAPIFDHRGRVFAAVSVSGPESRVDDERAQQMAAAVRDAAASITHRLGGTWPLETASSPSPSPDGDSDVREEERVGLGPATSRAV
ncbi:MAG TPA: IclR family transcriptional regulator [Thermomicrobiales bacterium]|nr:IclR family transcriptional regulator [Thermomicrobiales bacterium]